MKNFSNHWLYLLILTYYVKYLIIKSRFNRKELFILGNGLMDKNKAMARIISLMVIITVECLRMERLKAKEGFITLMEITIMDNGKMINHMELVSINL
jgi:hypothetical protein